MATRQPVPGSIEEETRRTLQNIEAILVAGGCSLESVVKCTCYLASLDDFAGFDAVYREFFSSPTPPARTTVGSSLLAGIRVEVDVIAYMPTPQ
jgi:2-iminobutanoate/2-iminopropanoate deaminase